MSAMPHKPDCLLSKRYLIPETIGLSKVVFISEYFGNICVLNLLQYEIIRLLWLSPHIYSNLVDNSF
ncbi:MULTISPECIES: hypothetical protein [unclassified Nostoc]|uniref:hypothetical protein n=2 Tax=Nostoc TaxID=1177 RepID=UPI0011812D42|nr:hypothetical protein [Nostoc sp. 'Peltigera membranacea cyanobiont' 232]